MSQSTTRSGHRRHRRVTLALAAVACVVSLGIMRGAAQAAGPFTIDPAMTKGPPTAPVTIVEFSDYQ